MPTGTTAARYRAADRLPRWPTWAAAATISVGIGACLVGGVRETAAVLAVPAAAAVFVSYAALGAGLLVGLGAPGAQIVRAVRARRDAERGAAADRA